jgi:hypothetical protein
MFSNIPVNITSHSSGKHFAQSSCFTAFLDTTSLSNLSALLRLRMIFQCLSENVI